MIRRPPRSTLFPTRRSSDLDAARLAGDHGLPRAHLDQAVDAEDEIVDVVELVADGLLGLGDVGRDRKSTRLNSSHANISYAVFCLKKKNNSPTSVDTTSVVA